MYDVGFFLHYRICQCNVKYMSDIIYGLPVCQSVDNNTFIHTDQHNYVIEVLPLQCTRVQTACGFVI